MEKIYKVGDRFGRWSLLRIMPPRGTSRIWLVICDCGHQATVYASNLTNGRSTGCRRCGALNRKE